MTHGRVIEELSHPDAQELLSSAQLARLAPVRVRLAPSLMP
jgi:hypothetical protein